MIAQLRTLGVGCVALFLGTSLTRGEVVPVAVANGKCEWIVPAGSRPFHLVVGSLGAAGKSFKVTIRSENTEAPPRLEREPQPDDAARLQDLARQADRCRRLRQAPPPWPPRQEPARRRVFCVFTAERDLENPANYTQIVAELCKVGKFVQVYRDALDPLTADLDLAVNDVVRTFDDEVYPYSRQNLGQAADVDRDGRFSVLFSSCLGRLQGGNVSLDGFVRSSDFRAEAEYGPPFGNRCDMLYLNARLEAGPHLRTVLAHEFTHAVALSERELFHPPGCRLEEENWLNEGLAHLVEEVHQHGWSNLAQRIRTYLAEPESFPLVVPDYYGNGLVRNAGSRGSAFLFLHWCCLHSDGELPRRLVQSPFAGVRNVECAMRQPFANLFRGWAVSMIQGDAFRELPRELRAATAKERTAGPVPIPLGGPSFETLTAKGREFTLASTGLKYFLVPATQGKSNRRFRIEADGEAHLQVTLVVRDEG